jgi:hypothetical protein
MQPGMPVGVCALTTPGGIHAGMAVGFDNRSMFRRDDLCHGPKISLKVLPPFSSLRQGSAAGYLRGKFYVRLVESAHHLPA